MKKGLYKHFKGTIYNVIGTGFHSETQEEYVMYYPVNDDSKIWLRPLSMFNETIDKDGIKLKRFEYCTEII